MSNLEYRVAERIRTWERFSHYFGVFPGHLPRRRVKRINGELRQAGIGAKVSTYNDPVMGPFGWFSCWNQGEPFNTNTTRETFAVLRARGLWCDEYENEKGRRVPAGPVGRRRAVLRRQRPRHPRVLFVGELMASLGVVVPSVVHKEQRMRDQLWRLDWEGPDSDQISIAQHGQRLVKVWHAPNVDHWDIGRAPGARRPYETCLLVHWFDSGVGDSWWMSPSSRSHFTRDRDVRRITRRRWQTRRRQQMQNRNSARWVP